jgi:glycosyltransferase involved in cell wall biosynthesis
MKVSIITNEDVASGLFQTQVFDLAVSISARDSKVKVHLFVINRFWRLREYRCWKKKHCNIIKESRIQVHLIPFLPPLRGVVSSRFLSQMMVIYLSLLIRFCSVINTSDVLHARGYWIMMALHRNGRRNVYFDPRSLWVLENISAGNIKQNSKTHNYWLEQEKIIVSCAGFIAVVSAGMKEYYIMEYSAQRIEVIPIAANDQLFKCGNRDRTKLRRELGWDDNTIFVYSGSLGLSGINKLSLEKMFSIVLNAKNSRLIILSNESPLRLGKLIRQAHLRKDKYIIKSADHDSIWKWLAASDFGVHALPKQLDSATRLGTKVVEYWSSSLPVLVNNHVGAACDYIKNNSNLGAVLDLDHSPTPILEIERPCQDQKRLIREFALRNFSWDYIGGRILHFYKNLAKG